MAYEYEVVVEDLLRRIRQGEWREGDKLPPLSALEKLYPQSRMTLYKALRQLTDQGYLVMSRRRGTFVRASVIRQRIAILTGAQAFDQSIAPFAIQAFWRAHATLLTHGFDAQLYTEDPLAQDALPAGLRAEFEQRKLAGLLTVSATFPWRYMKSPEWKRHGLPHVNLGEGDAAYNVSVDHRAFLKLAVDRAAAMGRRRVALLQREEHAGHNLEFFAERCREAGAEAHALPRRLPPAGLGYEEYGYRLLEGVWSSRHRPDAAVVPDDVIAKGVSQAATALRIRPPGDLAILAMTNRGAGFFYPAPIIPLELDVPAMADQAVAILLRLVAGEAAAPVSIRVAPTPRDGR